MLTDPLKDFEYFYSSAKQMFMSTSNDEERAAAAAVCKALRTVLDDLGLSSRDVFDLTGIPASSIRRFINCVAEPKLSQIVHIEKAVKVAPGTIARQAGLIAVGTVPDMIRTDPLLHPLFRETGVEHYKSWVKASTELSKR